MEEVIDKIGQSSFQNDCKREKEQIIWLAPNHQLMDLEPVEADDMLVIGTNDDLKRFEQTYCV